MKHSNEKHKTPLRVENVLISQCLIQFIFSFFRVLDQKVNMKKKIGVYESRDHKRDIHVNGSHVYQELTTPNSVR